MQIKVEISEKLAARAKDPRLSPQNRPVVITSKPASRAELRTTLLYTAGPVPGKKFRSDLSVSGLN